MKSTYKRLGGYIEPINQLNDGMEVEELLGISNNKYFQKSHTNTIGIDLATYRIVRRNQFAYNRATTRNGDKISIALRQGDDCIVSPSYRVFRSKDESQLNSEYLMMWFRRPEFDRYARFKSHGSAHEFFEFDQMLDVELPIPHIDKQREIVKEYNTIQDRIKLNEQMIQKLEETAQAIYKEWFVEGIDMENLPEGWRLSKIGYEVETKGGGTPSTENNDYWDDGDVIWYSPTDITHSNSIFISESATKITALGLNKSSAKLLPANSLMMTSRATVGKLAINILEASTNQGFITMIPTEELSVYYLYCWAKTQMDEIISLASGSTFLEISKSDFRSLNIVISENEINTKFKIRVKPIFDLLKNRTLENQKLRELKEFLLSRLAAVES